MVNPVRIGDDFGGTGLAENLGQTHGGNLPGIDNVGQHASFALFAEQNHLFFLFKIEGFLDWSDLAFNAYPRMTKFQLIEQISLKLPHLQQHDVEMAINITIEVMTQHSAF